MVFGKLGIGSSGSLPLSNLNGTNGFVLNGGGSLSGNSVSSVGDINEDGIADLIIGGSSNGATYVVFGKSDVGSLGSVVLSSLDGSNGFIISGAQSGAVPRE